LKKQCAALATLLLTCCCVAPPPPKPQDRPQPIPTPTPTATPVTPQGDDWRDWPITPGDWSYRATASGSNARFEVAGAASAELILICDTATRSIMIVRPVAAAASGAMTIQTSTGATAVPMSAGAARLPAANPLFDQIGFSRGRFMISIPGVPRLIAPAWPEILRVTEDCR
jgi:hypothetical protein